MEKREFKGNWMSITEDKANDLVRFGEKLEEKEKAYLLDHPAIRDLMFEVTGPAGMTELVICNTIPPSQVLKEARADRMIVSENALCFTFCNTVGRTVYFMFQSQMWVGDDGYFQGAYFSNPELKLNMTQQEIFDHEDDLLFMFLAVQFLMLHEPDLFSKRKSYQKGLKPASRGLPLAGPYTQPGRVVMYQMRDVTEEDADRIIHRHRMTAWHCPAWGVRGHYRHYKTGRVSYVKPYIKGKDRAAYMGREYALPDGAAITEVMI